MKDLINKKVKVFLESGIGLAGFLQEEGQEYYKLLKDEKPCYVFKRYVVSVTEDNEQEAYPKNDNFQPMTYHDYPKKRFRNEN
jgi:sRNA-binding regulator protein Hfq